MKVERDSIWVRGCQQTKKNRPERRTSNYVQQQLLEFPILFFCQSDAVVVKTRFAQPEVFQSKIQLPENVIQPIDEFLAVVSHPNPTEVLLD